MRNKYFDDLVDWFDFEKNSIKFENVRVTEKEKLWWICSKGHNFQKFPRSMKLSKVCPICNGRELRSGVNDLKTLFPKIAKEYDASDKNLLKSSEILAGSTKSAFWICKDCKNEWSKMSPSQRTIQKQNCPYCSNKRLLKGFNDLETLYPELIKEHWAFSKNLRKPSECRKSSEKYWWVCKYGHYYFRNIYKELSNGCPLCSKHTVDKGRNDFGSLANREIVEEWSSRNKKTPFEYFIKSSFNAWWICPKGHEYKAQIYRRAEGGGVCPYCLNRKLLKGFNDLETTYPEIAKEFDENLNKKKANEVITGSASKYWWRCSKNFQHVWETTLSLRISQNNGCPICISSKLEKDIADLIEEKFGRIIRNDRSILDGQEIDILIPEFNIGIEVNGDYWHSDEMVRKVKGMSAYDFHLSKLEKAGQKGFDLLFIWEHDWRNDKEEVLEALEKLEETGKADGLLRKLENERSLIK